MARRPRRTSLETSDTQIAAGSPEAGYGGQGATANGGRGRCGGVAVFGGGSVSRGAGTGWRRGSSMGGAYTGREGGGADNVQCGGGELAAPLLAR